MIAGLSYEHFEYLRSLRSGVADLVVAEHVRRHCEIRRWVAGGRLTDDGREVLERAEQSPPRKMAGMSEASRRELWLKWEARSARS